MNLEEELHWYSPRWEFNKDMDKANKTTPRTIFIGLSGKKQVGKDTAAKLICDELSRRKITFQVTSFAEPLKRMCIDILGLKPEGVFGTDADKNALSHIQWDGFPEEIRNKYAKDHILAGDGVLDPILRSGPMTNREVLQVMGTDIFRAIYGDVWANAPFNKDWSNCQVVILTDCRFPNEKLATEKHGGVIIRLERDTQFRDNHPSEIALDGYDFTNKYVNNGSVEDLRQYLLSLLKDKGILYGT